ncbi:MAG: alpha-glucan family phosphorylase [Chloroflexi bacterium]|nr:alpha-glucan family phosphorylase [Chloroflexota bacterium]
MEMGLDFAIPTYSGGMGVLAGDTLRAAADMGIPMVGVTLLYRQGQFRQHLDSQGIQSESPASWSPKQLLEPLPARVSIDMQGRTIHLCAWRYQVRGVTGHSVPVYLLDTALAENLRFDQTLTDHLYGGDEYYRLCQEVILGLGGVVMLRSLGYGSFETYHMNEGHAALVPLALLEEQTGGRDLSRVTSADIEMVRRLCVFTVHTPVAAGHDRFSLELVGRVLGPERTRLLLSVEGCRDDVLDLSCLAASFSHHVNAVSSRHAEISRDMFPNRTLHPITNGVHALTWTAPSFREVYDRHIPEWQRDNVYLRYAVRIPLEEIQRAHALAKRELLREVEQRTGVGLDPGAMTIGFARRATAYKRADLVFSSLDRLKEISRQVGPLQLIFGGKAHPRDAAGKAIIQRIFEAAAALGGSVHVVYLEEYDMALARYLCSGVDLWLNTPQRPLEASGTSGMKAALNGVPTLSVLDGWWLEGHVEGVTGWSIGNGLDEAGPGDDASSLYNKLEYVVLPMYYGRPSAYAEVMRSAIALNGSFFNTHRMLQQYLLNAYMPGE